MKRVKLAINGLVAAWWSGLLTVIDFLHRLLGQAGDATLAQLVATNHELFHLQEDYEVTPEARAQLERIEGQRRELLGILRGAAAQLSGLDNQHALIWRTQKRRTP